MSIARDAQAFVRLVNRVRLRRRTRRELAALLDERGPLPERAFEVAVYFSDKTVNLYQIRQWYEPLRQLSLRHPVVVVSRSLSTTAQLLRECPLPVFHGPTIADIEGFVAEQDLKLVLYVNQNMRNFQMMRFPGMFHVFINHGESEKVYMASNQAKAYDYCFVAGDAALQRISERLLAFDTTTRLLPIGRPQIDVTWPGPQLPADGRTVVLYAPTWEGDRPSMSYSSVGSHGAALVRALTQTGRHRVVFRPHPRTGVSDRAAGQAVNAIASILREANLRDPGARHLTDLDSTFGWHLQAADACVCDISAVAFDWLPTGKPLLLTEPTAEEAVLDRSGVVGALPVLAAEDASAIVERLDGLSRSERLAAHADLVRHHFGDTSPGASMGRFLSACETVIEARDRAAEALPALPSPRAGEDDRGDLPAVVDLGTASLPVTGAVATAERVVDLAIERSRTVDLPDRIACESRDT